MYSEADPLFMQQALRLGAQALHHATPNPRVGCVIVRDDQVLGEGYTQAPGGNHAEIEALQEVRRRGLDAQGATVYVTLEPCSHFGRTPPCATALIEARVARVVAAVEDPNPVVAGRGMEMLRQAGIDVRCGLLRQEAVEANVGFFSRMNRGRPWVRLKLAASLDGRTALASGRSQWITGEAARADVHAWRARSCALLTGRGTALADDPQLTVRDFVAPHPAPRPPLKVLLDSTLAVPADARLFEAPPAIVFCAQADAARRAALAARGIEVIAQDGGQARVALAPVLTELARRGINEVQVEAGPELAGAFVQADLADELLLYLAPLLIGPGRELLALPALQDLDAARRLVLHEATRIGSDLRLRARFQ